ncbi:hypothetical protein [Embleya sp. AB8]|uniref:hypothetical protein n=1 Tax=Embleya sp. AB8 TaxID=3156304 RepID=UPI003C70CA2A
MHYAYDTALQHPGAVQRCTGNYTDAIQLSRNGWAIHRDIGDRRGEANNLNEPANSLTLVEAHDQAVDLLAEAHRIQENIADRYVEATTPQQLGTIRRLTGNPPGGRKTP